MFLQIGSLSRDLVAKWKDIVTREEEREETEEGGREEGGGGREVNTIQAPNLVHEKSNWRTPLCNQYIELEHIK